MCKFRNFFFQDTDRQNQRQTIFAMHFPQSHWNASNERLDWCDWTRNREEYRCLSTRPENMRRKFNQIVDRTVRKTHPIIEQSASVLCRNSECHSASDRSERKFLIVSNGREHESWSLVACSEIGGVGTYVSNIFGGVCGVECIGRENWFGWEAIAVFGYSICGGCYYGEEKFGICQANTVPKAVILRVKDDESDSTSPKFQKCFFLSFGKAQVSSAMERITSYNLLRGLKFIFHGVCSKSVTHLTPSMYQLYEVSGNTA